MVCSKSLRSGSSLEGPIKNGKRHGWVDGIEVTELQIDYSNYDSLPVRAFKFLRYAGSALTLAIREPCDLVFATSTPLTAAIPGIAARWLRRKRFVFEVRDLWPELPHAMGVVTNPLVLGAMSALEYCSYRSAHAAIGLSPGIVEGIKRRAAPDLSVTMIPNGCDLNLFAPAMSEQPMIAGVAETDFVIVFTGAHGNANGLDSIVDVASILKQRGNDGIVFLFIGNGKCKPALLERKEDESLSNCIFMDSVPKRELPAIVARADLALVSLRNVPAFYYGTSPNKFFDYLAMGKPVLINHPGWLADMIEENSCGFVVSPDEPTQFADTLCELRSRRESLPAIGQNARRLGEREFDRTMLADQFVKALEEAACR